MIKIEDYAPIVGASDLEELRLLAQKMEGRTIQTINSTAVGGGVAEILTRMVPLLNELGVRTRWDVIKGDDRFFVITKNIHNALHGAAIDLSPEDQAYFREVNENNAAQMDLNGDFIFV